MARKRFVTLSVLSVTDIVLNHAGSLLTMVNFITAGLSIGAYIFVTIVLLDFPSSKRYWDYLDRLIPAGALLRPIIISGSSPPFSAARTGTPPSTRATRAALRTIQDILQALRHEWLCCLRWNVVIDVYAFDLVRVGCVLIQGRSSLGFVFIYVPAARVQPVFEVLLKFAMITLLDATISTLAYLGILTCALRLEGDNEANSMYNFARVCRTCQHAYLLD